MPQTETINPLDAKLGKYVQYLASKGFNRATLDVILREQTDSIKSLQAGEKIILPAELQMFKPLGNPPSFMSAYAVSGDTSYGMIFVSQDTAVNLTMAGSPGKTSNPLTFMHILKDRVGKILSDTRDKTDTLDVEIKDTFQSYSLVDFLKIDQIDSVLYNFLTDRPVLVVGPIDQAINVLVVMLVLIPERFQGRYGYSINMPYFSQESVNFAILDNVPQYNLEDEVNTYLQHDHSLVNLYENESYGEFTCAFAHEIIIALQANDLGAAQTIINSVFELARLVQEGETAQNFGDRMDISYDDADLVLDIARIVVGGQA